VAGFAWVEDLEAFCFTAVVGLDADETIRRLGGDPGQPAQRRTFEECFWPADGPQWAQVGVVDGGLMVAEHNGWHGEEAAATLSRGARIAAFFRNVEAVMHFVYAVDGDVIADFDPLLENCARSGSRPHLLDPALRGLPFGLHGAESSALCLIERLTGVAIRPDWLNHPQRAVQLPPLE